MFAHRSDDELDLPPVGQATADGAAQVVRIVPAGGLVLDEQALDELRQVFEGMDYTVFVPGPGSRVEVGQLDLVVLGPGPGAGSWVRLTDQMPDRGYATTGTGRLARAPEGGGAEMAGLSVPGAGGLLAAGMLGPGVVYAGAGGGGPRGSS